MAWSGPRWEGDVCSLGWSLLSFYEDTFIVPSGPRYGDPLILTDEQARFVVNLYAVHPVTGKRVYRRGGLRRSKGWGKSPLLAAIAGGELCGDVVFDGWDADGLPVGRPHPSPWLQFAAVSEDQTDNTYVPVYEMFQSSPRLDELHIDVGLTRIFLTDRPGRLEPVTAQAGSREGQPVTFAVLDETHLWTPANGGKKLAATLRRNVAKMSGLTVETTNAYVPGQDSVAEGTEEAWRAGQAGLLYDNLEGPHLGDDEFRDREKLKAALKVAYGDAVWIDLDRIADECYDKDTEPADARRFYVNEIVQSSEQAFDVERWRSLEQPHVVPDGALISLGFDGARFHDATAIIATEIASGHQFVPFGTAIWTPGGIDSPIDEADVERMLEQIFGRWRVWRGYFDPPYWESAIDRWQARWGDKVIIPWHTRRTTQMAWALRAYTTLMRSGEISHDGNPTFGNHIANARKLETRVYDEDHRPLFVIQKDNPNSPRKIDAAMAGCLSAEAYGDAIREGALAVDDRPAEFVSF